MGEIVVKVPADAGMSHGWGDWAILREPPQKLIVLDLSELESADLLFVLRLRGFIDWHTKKGFDVRVESPKARAVRSYLALMRLADDLPERCVCDIGSGGPLKKNDILIPIRRLTSRTESDALDDELGALYTAHLGEFADAFTRTVSEMCDNATTHGKSDVGVAYVTALRFPQTCVLAIGDLGIGIPAHMRQAFPELVEDEDAIREPRRRALRRPETLIGVSATSTSSTA